MSTNLVFLQGPITEKRSSFTTSGKPILFLRLKTWYKDESASQYHDVIAYNKLAEILSEYAVGKYIFITGSLSYKRDKSAFVKVVEFTGVDNE